ncbi:MAG: endolytic transglycosylase MltG [Candidatus Taylorbacteria bacterium]|nr:endolytic transglycosylase MltG [Candidatus Taylorbacteria bacterium]
MFKWFQKFKKFKAVAIIVAIAFILSLLATVFYLLYIPIYVGNVPIAAVIEEGQGSRAIARALKEKGLIRSELAFTAYVKLIGSDGSLKAGKYNFSGRLDVPGITLILVNGFSESEDIGLLVSEGFNVWEIDERLLKHGLIKEGEFSFKYYTEEGYLFPDTYRINKKAEGENFVLELRQRMADNFKNKTGELPGSLTREEQEEIIVIASILEKEARTEEDMRLVAGIIYKRLGLDIPLQVDATVVYGACLRNFQLLITNSQPVKNCDVTFQGPAREIKIDGLYNTYTRKGLPPAPISNPGLKSIEAALNPQESDYLYYLSTRDGSQMIYSKTAGEHAANRRKYLGI